MTKANSIQLVGDLIISLLGYFYWDWNIYFIVLFILLDVVAREILLEFKVRKIRLFTRQKGSNLPLIIDALIVCSLIFTAHFALKIAQPQLVLGEEFIRFLTYEDMGLPQGVLLIPLVGLMVYTEYKFQFLRFELFKRQQENTLRSLHRLDLVAAIIFSVFYIIIGLTWQIEESILVFSLLGMILIYRIIQSKIIVK